MRTWTLADHICRACGGRILKCASGQGMTPGGNPVWRCASCDKHTCGMIPDDLCWCGAYHRGNEHKKAPYMCLPFSILTEKPHLKQAFQSCGCDPDAGQEVGIILRSDYHGRT